MQKEQCIVPELEHQFEFVIAAHGYQCFQCQVCGFQTDVYEDSQP